MKQINDNQRKLGSLRTALFIAAMIALLILGAIIDVLVAHTSLHDHLRWTVVFFSALIIAVSAGLLLLWRGYVADHARAQERTIAALRESEARFHQMFEAHGAVMLLIDPQSDMIFDANQAAVQFYGYSKDALCALNISQLNMLTPEQVAAEYTRALHAERNYFVFPHRLADGTVRTVEVYSSPIAVQSKQVLFSIIHDITERKQAEEALRASEEEHRRTLEARVAERTAEVQDLYEKAPIGYHSLDVDGTLTMVNQAQLQWLGYAHEEMVGRPLAQFLAPDSLDLFRVSFAEFKLCGWVRDLELNMRHRDGSNVPVLISATAVYDEQGAYATSRSAVFNNTLRKQAAETLRLANAELARAARTKDEFLATMSHELRTPLNAILGLSESLLEEVRGPLNQRQQDSLRTIEGSGRHLLTLINDILDLSKVEAGRLEIHREVIVVAEVCQASMRFVKEQAARKSLKLVLHLSDQLVEMEADTRRLKQMLVNLLSNAVKFTPDYGQVSLDVSASAEAGVITFVVADTGIGIAPEDIPRLFQPFRQLDSSLSRQHEGTGLGLALVRKLAELHGGGVSVESELGAGSRFTIDLPYAPPAAPSMRVLLAEDNETNSFMLRSYLEDKGGQVTVARNGREAIACADAARFDVILMDIQMPEMDGLEAIRHLRAMPAYAATPIIALTALAMSGDRERCLSAGASAYLTKPVSLRTLMETIRPLLSG